MIAIALQAQEGAQPQAPVVALRTGGTHLSALHATKMLDATMIVFDSPGIASEAHALQSAFLTGNLGKSITVFTLNGIRLTDKLQQFDQFTLLLEGQDGIHSLVFKHAITTVTSASEAPGKQRQPE